MHMLTSVEIERWKPTGAVFPLNIAKMTNFILTVTEHQLKRYLPDLYWATVFGPP
jgi:hypothetical protein